MNGVALRLVAIAALTWLISCSKHQESFDKVNISTLPRLDYCSLRNDPDRYDGRIVRISAQIGNFGHGYYFDDKRCSEKVYEDLLDDNRTAVRLFESRATELQDTLERITNGVGRNHKPTSVLVAGRFTRRYPASHTDLMSDRTSFHFEIFSIEPTN